SAANDDDGSADEISVVDEEIDLEIVKAYETLTMNGRRRQSVDMEDVSQCSEK
uniref:Uncharacterized protein n=1 Tax=Romanomermis culicivorax TaxID=13658 RepID=A0A915IAK8_ROMCU